MRRRHDAFPSEDAPMEVEDHEVMRPFSLEAPDGEVPVGGVRECRDGGDGLQIGHTARQGISFAVVAFQGVFTAAIVGVGRVVVVAGFLVGAAGDDHQRVAVAIQ